MKYVDSGHGKFPLISLVSILSISLVVNLPGLAISPLMDDLDTIFPHASHLEIQLLGILPNLFIIPFVLLSGKLSVSKNKIRLLFLGLCIYLLSAVLYFFATSLLDLIIFSCILGIGCGMVIPLAAGLLADYFTGESRMKQLGVKSGIANFTLIFATLFVGWLGNISWHLPFLVYMVPVVPLVLIHFLKPGYIDKHAVYHPETTPKEVQSALPPHPDFHFKGKKAVRLLWGIMTLYFLATYGTMVITYYLPFRMQSVDLGSTEVGLVTSVFFLAITIPGFLLANIVRILRHFTLFTAIMSLMAGLFVSTFAAGLAAYIIGAFLIGSGYGIIQPIVYDKATYVAPDDKKATQYLSFVLSCNYVAISIAPFFITGMEYLFGVHNQLFPFLFNAGVMGVLALFSLIFFKSFVFKVDPDFYKHSEIAYE